MDPSLYKQLEVSRGFKYNYFASPASLGKPTLLFLHGFPSTSTHWHRQVEYFKREGYGLIVPDMLGYGGTDQPSEATEYAHSKLTTDVHEIVEREGPSKVFAIGHDWGSSIVSRLAVLYQEQSCYLGFGFVSVGYVLPQPLDFNYEEIVKFAPIGYWQFFSASDAPAVVKDNIESFIDLLFPKDPTVWKEHLGPLGSARKFIEGKRRIDRLKSITPEEYDQFKTTFLKNGFVGPFNYYKTMTANIAAEEAKDITEDKLTINKPVLYVSATEDAVSTPGYFLQYRAKTPKLTHKSLVAGHWVIFEKADEVNGAIEAWVNEVLGGA